MRRSDGQFLSATSLGNEVAIWHPDGSFERTLGREGRGPGEFVGTLTLYLDDSDTLHVRDNALAWTVFDPQFRFVRRMPASFIGYHQRNTALLTDGLFVSGAASASDSVPGYFHTAGTDGTHRNTFATLIDEDVEAFGYRDVERVLGSSGQPSFWAAYPAGSSKGYTLEHWSADGTLLKQVTFDADWFPKGHRSRASANERPPASIRALFVDANDRVWIKSAIANEHWVPPAQSLRLSTRERSEMYTFHYAVLSSAGRLLAEAVGRESEYPYAVFPRTSLAYRMIIDPESDVPTVDIVEYSLAPKPGHLPQSCE